MKTAEQISHVIDQAQRAIDISAQARETIAHDSDDEMAASHLHIACLYLKKAIGNLEAERKKLPKDKTVKKMLKQP